MLCRLTVNRPWFWWIAALTPLEGGGDTGARTAFDRDLARLLADHRMVLEEHARILGDWRKRPALRRIGGTVERVGMAHRKDVRMLGMDRRVHNEARLVDRITALDDPAVMVHQNEVGQLDLGEMHCHRVGPVELGIFRIADRQMAGKTVIQPPAREGPAAADQMALAVLAQLFRVVRIQLPGKFESRLLRLVNGYAIFEIEHGSAPPSGVANRYAQRPEPPWAAAEP